MVGSEADKVRPSRDLPYSASQVVGSLVMKRTTARVADTSSTRNSSISPLFELPADLSLLLQAFVKTIQKIPAITDFGTRLVNYRFLAKVVITNFRLVA